MRRVSSLRRLGLPLAPRIGRCPCPHRTLSSAAEPEALAAANPVQDLALSKGKMKRLKAIAAQKGIESAGVSRPELVQRILSANPTADSASNPQGADDHGKAQSESRPRIEYSEQLKQLSKAYHQLVTRLVAQDNDTAVSATLTRARAAGVEDWVLQTALEQQPMPDLDIAADPTPPEVQARLQAARQETARKAAEAEQRQQDQAAAEAAQRRAQQVEQIEQAIGSDERSAAEVRAECREHGLSSAAARDELLRRLMLHQIWASGEPEGKLPDDLAAVTLEHYTAAQLKTWCIDNRLPHTGTKGDLIDRLEGFSQGTGDHAARAKSRDIQTGAVKKYDLWAMNQSGNQSTTFIGIKSNVCYVDLGPGHIDRMDWVKSARRILNLTHDDHSSTLADAANVAAPNDTGIPDSYGVGGYGATGSGSDFWEDGNSRQHTAAFSQRDLSLPRSVHGYLAKETLPGSFGREQLRMTYDAIVAYLVPQSDVHTTVPDPTEEVYENMQRAERMIHVAERSLVTNGSILMATGQLELSQALELVDRMDQSFLDVMELSHGNALARARKVMNVLTQRAYMSIDRQRASLAPTTQQQSRAAGPGGVVSGTVGDMEARRLVKQWLSPSNREFAASVSNAAAFGPDGPSRYRQSEERTCEMISRELKRNRLFEPDRTDFYLLLGKNKVEATVGNQLSGPETSATMNGQVDLDWQLRLNGFAADLERESHSVASHGHRLEKQAHKESRARWAKPEYVRLGSPNDTP